MEVCQRSNITESLPGPDRDIPDLLRRSASRNPPILTSGLVAALLIGLATILAHGWALNDGLFLDDHLHQTKLQDDQWSWQALLHATTVKPADFIDTWWQEKPVEWQYARPVAILLAKVVYQLSGSVKALHAVSIVLHCATAYMVYVLCMGLTRQPFWSIVGGLLFVVYSHSVYAVGWLASQNSVLQTALTLAALLAYIRASGLDIYAARPRQAHQRSNPLDLSWLMTCLALWGLALFSRENAVVFPVFAVAVDLAFSGWRQVRARMPIYLLMAAAAIAFAVWRLMQCDQPMPDFYFRRPAGFEYVFWWLAKLMHYLTAVVWLSPMTVGPSGRFNPFLEVPGDCLLMFAILGFMGMGYYFACRRARGYWIWPLWMVFALLPVVPVLATPHSGYMPGIGFAIAMVIGPALREHIQPVGIGKWSRGIALWFLIATCTYVPIYRTMWRSVNAAERYTMNGVMQSPPSREATDLFFINLPFVNIYAQLHARAAMKAELDLDDHDPRLASQVHVLTYSPNPLRMDDACRIEQIDEYSFRLSIEGRPYFSGALGRFLVEGMRGRERFHSGEIIPHPQFEVEIGNADEEGVRELVFRFHEPLASPKFCFYMTTNQSGAARVQFWRKGDGERVVSVIHPTGQETLRDTRDALFNIRWIASKVIQTDLYLTGPPFPGPR